MLKRLLMHGECLDVPYNLAPADMWSEVANAKAGDGCMVPALDVRSALYYAPNPAEYPWHLRLTRGWNGSAWEDQWLKITTDAAALTSSTVELRRYSFTGSVLDSSASPTEWVTPGRYAQQQLSNSWTGGRFNGWEVFNSPGAISGANGLYPCALDMTTNPIPGAAVRLTGWNVTAPNQWRTYALRPYRDFLVAMQRWTGSTTIDDTTVFWSDAAAAGIPGTWTPAAGNMAGDADLHDTPGPLIDGCILGNDFIIFKSGSCIRMTYVGGAQVFAFQVLNSSAGIINRNCAVAYQGKLLVFGPNDIYALSPDGSTESLMTDGIRRALYRRMNRITLPQYDHCSLQISTAEGRLYAFYSDTPAADYYATKAAVLDLRTGRWGEMSLGIAGGATGFASSASAQRSAGQINIGYSAPSYVYLVGAEGSGTTNIYQMTGEMTPASDPANLGPVIFTRRAIDCDEPQISKTLRAIRLLVDAPAGTPFTVTVTGRQILDGAAVETSGTLSWTAGTTEQLDCLVQGKFFDVQVVNNYAVANYTDWKLYGLELEYTLRGGW